MTAILQTSGAEASFKPVTSALLNFLRSGGAPPIDERKMELAKVAARLIFGQIRKDDAADPDTFFTAAALALTSYEPDVIVYIVDPRTGIAKHGTWVPSIKELHDACRARAIELATVQRYREMPSPAGRALLPAPPKRSYSLDEIKDDDLRDAFRRLEANVRKSP